MFYAKIEVLKHKLESQFPGGILKTQIAGPSL